MLFKVFSIRPLALSLMHVLKIAIALKHKVCYDNAS
jgi:hypothetical protein